MTAHANDARVLICDCDGVLIDSETIAADVLVRELEARWPGVAARPIVLPLLDCAPSACSTARARARAARSPIRISKRFGAASRRPRFRRRSSTASTRRSRESTWTIACASNSRRHYVDAALRRTGLKRFFGERLFCADGVARPKPAPDVYLAAAQALGVAPSQCLVVEDSATGVTAASAAGMTVLGFVGGGHASPRQVDALRAIGARRVFDDMRELPGLVSRWAETGVVEPH